jgi:hypothetical protein
MIAVYIVVGIIVILLIFFWVTYNRLVRMHNGMGKHRRSPYRRSAYQTGLYVPWSYPVPARSGTGFFDSCGLK